jgi:hypothetical protein
MQTASIWRVDGRFSDEMVLMELQFTESLWIEYYAEFADCPEPLAGIG